LAAPARELEGDVRNAAHLLARLPPGVDRFLGLLEARLAEVDPARQLAYDQDVGLPHERFLERRWQAQIAGRPQVGVHVERAPQPEQALLRPHRGALPLRPA